MPENSKVVSIDKPRCSRCGAFRPVEELNGYDPFAPVGQKYTNAYCKRLADCNSSEAQQVMKELADHLD